VRFEPSVLRDATDVSKTASCRLFLWRTRWRGRMWGARRYFFVICELIHIRRGSLRIATGLPEELFVLRAAWTRGPIAGTDVMDIAGCSLAELIDDPLIGLVMSSDGVDRRELELLLERVARERAIRLANDQRTGQRISRHHHLLLRRANRSQ
jgi:hypothetical protein